MSRVIQELEEKIKRLPKWAQRYFDKLKRDLERARFIQKAIAEEDSPVWWYDLGTFEKENYLPPRTTIVLKVKQAYIETSLSSDGEYIQVRSSHGRLSISPKAANEIAIRVEK